MTRRRTYSAGIATYSRWAGRTLMAVAAVGGVGVVVVASLLEKRRDEIQHLASYSNDGYRVMGFWLFVWTAFLVSTFVYGGGLVRVGTLLSTRVTARGLLVATALWCIPLLWGLLSLAFLLHYRTGYALEPVTLSRTAALGAVIASVVAFCLTTRAYRTYSAGGSSGSLSLTPR